MMTSPHGLNPAHGLWLLRLYERPGPILLRAQGRNKTPIRGRGRERNLLPKRAVLTYKGASAKGAGLLIQGSAPLCGRLDVVIPAVPVCGRIDMLQHAEDH